VDHLIPPNCDEIPIAAVLVKHGKYNISFLHAVLPTSLPCYLKRTVEKHWDNFNIVLRTFSMTFALPNKRMGFNFQPRLHKRLKKIYVTFYNAAKG
jgi:hypothetical protein